MMMITTTTMMMMEIEMAIMLRSTLLRVVSRAAAVGWPQQYT